MIGTAFDAMRSDAGRFGDALAVAFRTEDTTEARAAMMLLAYALQRMGAGKDV